MRDSNVVHVAEIIGQVPFRMLTQGLHDAVLEAEAEGMLDASRDPAVMLFGAFIAFHTHVDVNTVGGYQDLLNMCHDRMNEVVVAQ